MIKANKKKIDEAQKELISKAERRTFPGLDPAMSDLAAAAFQDAPRPLKRSAGNVGNAENAKRPSVSLVSKSLIVFSYSHHGPLNHRILTIDSRSSSVEHHVMPVFKIWIARGERLAHTAVEAPDVVFAIMKVEAFFEGSGWQAIR